MGVLGFGELFSNCSTPVRRGYHYQKFVGTKIRFPYGYKTYGTKFDCSNLEEISGLNKGLINSWGS